MAEYIADTEEQNLAELSGTYTKDEANKVMRFGATGQADTGFILPDDGSEWLLIEVFDVEDTAGDIGYTIWTSNLYNLAADLVSARTTATAEYTLYQIVATHYYGDDTADIYRGDNATALALAGADTGIAFTPSAASWKMTDTTIAPEDVLETTFITFHSTGSTPSTPPNPMSDGSYVNVFNSHSSTTQELTLVDVDNTTTGEIATQTADFWWYTDDGRDSGNDSYAMPDDLMATSFYVGETTKFGEVTLELTASTDYRITVTSSSAAFTGLPLHATIDGANEKIITDGYANPPESISWDITTDATPSDVVVLFYSNGVDSGAVSGMKIERLS